MNDKPSNPLPWGFCIAMGLILWFGFFKPTPAEHETFKAEVAAYKDRQQLEIDNARFACNEWGMASECARYVELTK